jgi:hypothetical protein
MKKKLNEAYPVVVPSSYKFIEFKGDSVGNNINPSLLADIDAAASKVGTKVGITSAKSGNDIRDRHEKGNAVDIRTFDGKVFLNQKDAINKGIARQIYDFVKVLMSQGYLYNQETSNDKSVLGFELAGYDDHIHVSRNSSSKLPDNTNTTEPVTTVTTTVATGDRHHVYGSEEGGGLLDVIPGLDKLKQDMNTMINLTNSIDDKSNRLNEEIKRIKKMMKK